MDRHQTITAPFGARAENAVHPLAAYLLRLMQLKSSNLCLSGDVATSRDLLQIADQMGPSIVVLKTHHDAVSGWDYCSDTGTGPRLAALARKHGFLIFEDRKLSDIGNTVQLQYVGGSARIIEWAHLVNINMAPGPAMVTALADAATRWHDRYPYKVKTSVSVGTRQAEHDMNEDECDPLSDTPMTTCDDGDANHNQTVDRHSDDSPAASATIATTATPATTGNDHDAGSRGSDGNETYFGEKYSFLSNFDSTSLGNLAGGSNESGDKRKGSIVSTTTVTQHYEPAVSPLQSKRVVLGSPEDLGIFPGIEETPMDRGLLILAQMSTEGNLMGAEYTRACVAAARRHRQFVVGFVSQQSLNSEPGDEFVHLAPGCRLPPAGDDERDSTALVSGDGKGQHYNSPSHLVGGAGVDIVIVGRGIIEAANPQAEADRYRQEAWQAYLSRLR